MNFTVYSVGEALAKKPDYEKIYRAAYPSGMHPAFYPHAQGSLSDLWPAKQNEFKRLVDALLDATS